MKKTVCIFLTIMLLAAALVGCAKSTPADPAETRTPNAADPAVQPPASQYIPGDTGYVLPGETEYAPPDSTEPYARVTKEEQLAMSFIDALLHQEFEKVLPLLASADDPNAIIFPEDVAWALPRTSYKDLDYFDPETVKYTTSLGSSGTVSVNVEDGKGEHQTFEVKTLISKTSGQPMVNGRGVFYVEECSLRVPSGVTVSVNGVELPNSMIVKRQSGKWGFTTDYCIPTLGIREKAIHLHCDNFDTEQVFTPVGHNSLDSESASKLSFLPSLENPSEAFDAVKDLWNNMYAAVHEEGATPSVLDGFIASDAPIDTASIIFEAYNNLGKNEREHRVTQVVQRKESIAPSWFSDHVIAVNFGYQLDYISHAGWDSNHDMRTVSAIFLAYEDGAWKIARVVYPDLFSYTNYMTHEW
jgi:hypothetical protein